MSTEKIKTRSCMFQKNHEIRTSAAAGMPVNAQTSQGIHNHVQQMHQNINQQMYGQLLAVQNGASIQSQRLNVQPGAQAFNCAVQGQGLGGRSQRTVYACSFHDEQSAGNNQEMLLIKHETITPPVSRKSVSFSQVAGFFSFFSMFFLRGLFFFYFLSYSCLI